VNHAGRDIRSRNDSVFPCRLGIYERMRPALAKPMEYIVGLIVAAGLGVYLFYALLRPERF
jgi:K+-transporting ATPase KdpF subunit